MDSWTGRLSSTDKRYQSAPQSRSDFFLGFEDMDADEDFREDFPCPVCEESFDVIALCCHIDEEHPWEAKNGVCPICMLRVGFDMVAHITLHHGNIFKRKRKSRKGGSHSTLALLRKELREANLKSLFGGSSCLVASLNAESDSLLSSFVLPVTAEPSHLSIEAYSARKLPDENQMQRSVPYLPAPSKDHEEKTKRSLFVQGLFFSMVSDDVL